MIRRLLRTVRLVAALFFTLSEMALRDYFMDYRRERPRRARAARKLGKVVGWIADLLIPAEYHTKEKADA